MSALLALLGRSAAAAAAPFGAGEAERRARALADGRIEEGPDHLLVALPDQAAGQLSWAAGGGVWVAADAAIYYRDDLRDALLAAGVAVGADSSPAALVLAAYRAWGTGAAARLEG